MPLTDDTTTSSARLAVLRARLVSGISSRARDVWSAGRTLDFGMPHQEIDDRPAILGRPDEHARTILMAVGQLLRVYDDVQTADSHAEREAFARQWREGCDRLAASVRYGDNMLRGLADWAANDNEVM